MDIEPAELRTGRRTWDWPQKFFLPLMLILGGFFANEFVSFVVLRQAFAQHIVSYGHDGVAKDMKETTRILSALTVEVQSIKERQLDTGGEVKRLVQDQRDDMREVRRALRIPDR